jgi:hypothetical protein
VIAGSYGNIRFGLTAEAAVQIKIKKSKVKKSSLRSEPFLTFDFLIFIYA